MTLVNTEMVSATHKVQGPVEICNFVDTWIWVVCCRAVPPFGMSEFLSYRGSLEDCLEFQS